VPRWCDFCECRRYNLVIRPRLTCKIPKALEHKREAGCEVEKQHAAKKRATKKELPRRELPRRELPRRELLRRELLKESYQEESYQEESC